MNKELIKLLTVGVISRKNHFSRIQRQYYYLDNYQKLQKQVTQQEAFVDNPDWNVDPWEVDLEIAIIVLSSSMNNSEEVKKILAESPQLKQWKASLSQDNYDSQVSQYIEKLCQWALQLQQWRQEESASGVQSLHSEVAHSFSH
ncbi:MAG: hypothetical protein AB4038_06195 [Prochloraceae cyanobacterium]